jgi:signal transduction histidine kinase
MAPTVASSDHPAQRRGPRAFVVPAACGVVLGAAWALACPWLVALDGAQAAPLRPWLFAAGLTAGLVTAGLGARAGAGWALRAGVALGGVGSFAALLLALALTRKLDGARATALALTGVGSSVALGLLLALLASVTRSERAADEDSAGAPLGLLVAGACGALAFAAWALASGHLVGQRVSDADRHALDEARDLVAIGAGRLAHAGPADFDALAVRLAPPGGWFVSVDERGAIEAGAGAGAPTSAIVELDGDGVRCRAGRRVLPCAVRRVGERRLIAGVEPQPIASGAVLTFALAGLATALVALVIGALVSASPARELDHVARGLDELARGARGPSLLDRPIVIASLDEVGDLTAALNRLRERLGPILSEYRVALDKAQAADAARTEFLSLVSAELRGPLDQLVAAADALLDPNAEPLTAEQADDVRTVLSAARHLSDLIDEVLDVSAIASGQITLRLASFDLGQLAEDVAKTQRPQLQRKGVELRLDVERPSPRVLGDEKRLRQVLTNLITNAVKFTDKGWIEVKVQSRGERVAVSVRDTGPGIAPEQLPRLFHEFVQLGSLKQRAHGTGLGLAICKRLVEAHGGEVSATSTVGEGSTFSLAVPAGGPEASAGRLETAA